MKTGDWVRFKGGTDLFQIRDDLGDDKILVHDRTGRVFCVDYRALEVVYAKRQLSRAEIDELFRLMDERLSKPATKDEVGK